MNNDNIDTISIFGLGYVGCVSMACLSKAGYQVIGVELNDAKIALINAGIPTIVEPGLDELILKGKLSGKVMATNNAEDAILKSNIAIITVGTPSLENGELDLSHVYSVAENIGIALRTKEKFLTIAIRSTIKPGTCEKVTQIIEQFSGKKRVEHFSVMANPEFLREGTAIDDYVNPPYVLIGSDDPKGTEILARIYSNVNAEIISVGVKSAEIIKYVNNTWHAVKVAFGNEIGSLCKKMDIDSQEVINLFCKDRILNISPYYLKPGFAFGGACLPKDLSALVALSNNNDLDAPLISNVMKSNNAHINRAYELIKKKGIGKRIGILGLSFKNNTDDVRNSPIVEILKKLLKENFKVKVYDDYVSLALKSGRNATTTRSILGEIEQLLVSSEDEIVEFSDIVVIAKKDPVFVDIIQKMNGIKVIDLVFLKNLRNNCVEYDGLAW